MHNEFDLFLMDGNQKETLCHWLRLIFNTLYYLLMSQPVAN
jgi:hypothetical protein